MIAPLHLPNDMFLPSPVTRRSASAMLPPSDITSATRRMLAPVSLSKDLPAHGPDVLFLDHPPKPRLRPSPSMPLSLTARAELHSPTTATIPTPLHPRRRTLSLPVIHESASQSHAIPRKRRFPVTGESSRLLLKVATANSAKLRSSSVNSSLTDDIGSGLPVLRDSPMETFDNPTSLAEAVLSELMNAKAFPTPPSMESLPPSDGLPRFSRLKRSGSRVKRFGGTIKRSLSWNQTMFALKRTEIGIPAPVAVEG